MLTIRLQRVGRKNQPVYRIVLAEKYRSATKKVNEILGHYNPRTKEFGIKDQQRLSYWIGQHVEISPTVHNLFVSKGLVKDKKIQAWKPKKKEKTEPAGVGQTPAATETKPANIGDQSVEKAENPATETKSV